MSADGAGALLGAAVCLAAAPYLARLTLSAPDRDDPRWWRGRAASRARLVLTALTAALLGALAGATAGLSALLPALLALALLGAALTVIDFETHRLPNRLVFTLVGAEVVLGLLAAAARDQWGHLGRAALAGVAVFAVLFTLRAISPGGFGYGDVKLGGAVAGYLGWFGWLHVFYGVFAGFLLGAVLSLALLATRRASMKTALAFGPMLILGPLLVLAFDLVPHTG